MHLEDAIGGIKFALGENVKRSQSRYPNTRMGVQTTIRDAFTAAVDYQRAWDRYMDLPRQEQSRTMPPRRDLELDALVEVLEGDRLVHCHSYRQDEILMLIRVADEFGFTIGTFQHVLEGYKVADAIAEHGAGASTFSDWWAYKVEVAVRMHASVCWRRMAATPAKTTPTPHSPWRINLLPWKSSLRSTTSSLTLMNP